MKTLLLFLVFGLTLTLQSCKNTPTIKNADNQTVTTVQKEVVKQEKTYLNTPKEFYDFIQSKKVQLVDVRTPEEFNEGHIKGAVNICVTCDGFNSKVSSLDKSKPVYVYCRSGHRSGNATKILSKIGFEEVHDMDGGILAWQANNLPIEN